MANLSRTRSRKRAKGEIYHLVSNKSSTESSPVFSLTSGEQPLNLCVRDESLPVTSSALITEEQVPKNPVTRRRKKRSAIFLPPEKLADNDVCICKFKFVAGHTPRLQEKKILSLDSGGNFRFFPEMQQEKQTQNQTPMEVQHVTPVQPIAVNQQIKNSKPIPDLLPIETLHPTTQCTQSAKKTVVDQSSIVIHHSNNRRLSRRQKMEQTFGDKGFLIQTQHVPATEGSAFCKFRQLKKFTRYLYRSWRHYLPEENQKVSASTEEG